MKTIEQKAKAYDEALSVAQETYTTQPMYRDWLAKMFPELKENEDEKWIPKEIAEYLKEKGGFRSCWLAWLEKQGDITKLSEEEQNRFAKGVLSNCAMSFIDYLDAHNCEGKMCVSNGDCADIENAFHNGMWDKLHRYYCKYIEKQNEQTLANSTKACKDEQNPTDKIEPKFKVGDWIITNKNHIWYVDETPETTSYLYRLINQYSKVEIAEFEIVDKKAKLWTINDAKDGDVLASNRSIFIFSQEYIAGKPEAHCGIMNGFFIAKPEGCWANEKCYPATKEQRDVLFSKMKEAGYEWDAEKLELKKIEQKPAWSEEDEEWKPSEEQIKVLEFFIPYVTKCSVVLQKSKDTLLSLLSDLKKLREE